MMTTSVTVLNMAVFTCGTLLWKLALRAGTYPILLNGKLYLQPLVECL